MGAWGYKLYDNDTAEDIKDTYNEKLKSGKSNEEATQEILEEYEDMLDDIDDGPNIWMALADQQWRLGRLLPHVKKQALKCIEKGADLQIWYAESKEMGDARKKEIDKLKEKLNSPQPPEKKIRKPRYYTCPWKIGDVFAYKMECDLAKEHGLYGQYIIFQKAGNRFREVSDYEVEGHTSPIVRCWLSDEPSFNSKSICVKSLRRPVTDETYRYAFAITTTSSRVIPKKLIYLGNYELEIPKDDAGNIETHNLILMWQYFEDFIIKNYLVCNLHKYNSLYDFDK